MSSTHGADGEGSGNGAPALPPNVHIFSPTDPNAANSLLNGQIFTRLVASPQTEQSKLILSLNSPPRPELNDSFYLCHRNHILIFDSNQGGGDLQDVHHEHFRLVCLALKDQDIGLDFAACVFDVPNILQAGFQVDKLGGGAVLVIDLMEREDDVESDIESDDEGVAENILANGKLGATMS